MINVTHRDVVDAVYSMFPPGEKSGWGYNAPMQVVRLHYLSCGANIFCCANNVAWQLHYEAKTLEGHRGEIEHYLEITKVERVELPQDAIYSHTNIHVMWAGGFVEEFSAETENHIRSIANLEALVFLMD